MCIELGASDFITKPILSNDLILKLQYALGLW
jgi:FixJ family two-component response regulator